MGLELKDGSPLQLDVLVHKDGDAHGNQGKEDAGHEHDADTEYAAQDRERPASDEYVIVQIWTQYDDKYAGEIFYSVVNITPYYC